MRSTTINARKRRELKKNCVNYLNAIESIGSVPLSTGEKIAVLEEWYTIIAGEVYFHFLEILHHFGINSEEDKVKIELIRQQFEIQEICEEVAAKIKASFPDMVFRLHNFTRAQITQSFCKRGVQL